MELICFLVQTWEKFVMATTVQNIDETLSFLLKLQEDTEKAVKEAGEALRIYIEKSAIIHNNRQQTSLKSPIMVKNGRATSIVAKNGNGMATPSTKPAKSKRPGKKGDFDNKTSLKEAIKTALASFSNGAKVGDIVDFIESNKTWQTSGNLESQIQTNLYSMKNAGLVDRDENNTYRNV